MKFHSFNIYIRKVRYFIIHAYRRSRLLHFIFHISYYISEYYFINRFYEFELRLKLILTQVETN